MAADALVAAKLIAAPATNTAFVRGLISVLLYYKTFANTPVSRGRDRCEAMRVLQR
jgi:hypothetical protein